MGGSESVQAASPFLNLIPCEWNPKFATRRDLDYSIENKPHIEARAELGAGDNVETRAEPVEEESVVRMFMLGPDESDVCLPQADKVEAFCFGANLESLRAEKGKVSEPCALLDERSFAAGKGRSRTYRGPLTAGDLYKELKKPRFRCGGSNHSTGTLGALRSTNGAAGNSSNSNPNESQDQDEEPDAERRLVFISDLDRWSIYALIGTASYYQAFPLRDAIYKHLAFENFIGVTFPPEGLAMFQLAFHLPYYVWRSSPKACEDHRRDANASPLRQSRDVSFLNWKSSGPFGFLYEAQISCVVAGSDEWRWVAYCFVDTYFDPPEEGKETVQSYHEDSLIDEGMRADPFTFGIIRADKPIQKPREYFLMVFRIRIAQVKREWQQVVAQVKQSIREYVQTHRYSLSQSRERFSSEEAEDYDEKVRKSRDWVVQVRRLSRQLSQDLSKTVDACQRFCLKHVVYFRNLSESADSHQSSLSAIQTTFDELESLKKTLESLAERCDDFARDLELQLILENLEVSNRQHKVAEDNKGLAMIMMLYISPIALTAGIFSMNKDVIPFIPARFGSFIGLVFMFSVLGVVIHAVQLYQTWRWQGWDKKIRGRLLEMLQFRSDSFIGQPTRETQEDVAYELAELSPDARLGVGSPKLPLIAPFPQSSFGNFQSLHLAEEAV